MKPIYLHKVMGQKQNWRRQQSNIKVPDVFGNPDLEFADREWAVLNGLG